MNGGVRIMDVKNVILIRTGGAGCVVTPATCNGSAIRVPFCRRGEWCRTGCLLKPPMRLT